MRSFQFVGSLLLALALSTCGQAADANRLTYLDESDPYYVGRTFPRLVTPQWVGEKGVQAVVILAIDDMRDPAVYEKFLRPILRRLKKIDGRAPLSIMSNRIDPRHPQLQKWLKEGLSLETHTLDHPCPFFQGGSFAKARATYDGCVDLLNAVPGNRPVAFRMPCCDSLNTPSPRFYAEIFNRTTAKGHFLTVDSSVFNVLTSNDPELPRDLVQEPDGRDRFLKYLPRDRSFVNTIENYPYPYVLGRLCWEFPCVTPSDWEAFHLHGAYNPATVRDLKAALDAIVLKKGTFTLVFHPHGWIKNAQIVDLIDHVVAAHGSKVKFLTFREAQERLNKNLLGGQPLRAADGGDNGVRLIDLDNDGYLDVVIGNDQVRQTRRWSPAKGTWTVSDFPVRLVSTDGHGNRSETGVRFGVFGKSRRPSLLVRNGKTAGAWTFDGRRWVQAPRRLAGLTSKGRPILTARQGRDEGVRLRDLDGDGRCELLVGNPRQRAVFAWSRRDRKWRKLPFTLPPGATFVDAKGKDAGLRFIDIDDDGRDDVVFANEKGYGLYLFTSLQKGWDQRARTSRRDEPVTIPMITRAGTSNGAWFHSRHLWVQNENTALFKDHVDRRSFNELLEGTEPRAKAPAASLRSIRLRPGFRAELVVSEPLVRDPIAFAWGADGKLWVVEMGDYPLGVDGKGKPGGRIKYLEDTKGTGRYDKATLFLDGLSFPTSVMPWRKGVIVTCAPEIFFAEDTKGTGRADLRVPLYRGFIEGNPQHRVNSLVWGLDNWIYCANGDSGGVVRSLKTGKTVNLRGREFRIRPDTGDIDLVAGQTQYGRSRDDWGNWFGCNNSNSMWHYPLPDHYLRRNPHLAPPDPRVSVPVVPGAAPVYPVSRTLPRFNDLWAANHFTSACSVIVYRDDLFGPAFAGNSFVSEPVHNLVHREIMRPRGVIFTSRRAADETDSEFLASSDNWFRPTTIQTGPDGALWVADMYRAVIEHPEWIPKDWQKRLDLRAGSDMGRIYRVYPVGKRPRPIPRLDRLRTAELVAALDSPSGWQRDTAQRLLLERHDQAAVPLLESIATGGRHALGRLHALCTLDGLDALAPRLLKKALGDKHPGVRRHALRLCDTRLGQHPELGAALGKLARDPDAQVQMQLAFTLGEWHHADAGRILGELALRHAADPYLSAAVMSSINRRNLSTVLLTVLARSRTVAPPAALTNTLFRLGDAFGDTRVTVTLLEAIAKADNGKYAPWQFAALAGLLDTLDRRNSSLAKLQRAGDDAMRAALGHLSNLFAAARATLRDEKAARTDRLLAMRLVGRGLDRHAEDRKTLADLLVPQTPDEFQAAAVDALGRLPDARVPELLLRGWKGYGPALRSRVLDVLLRRTDRIRAVLDAVRHKEILVFEIDAVRRQRLLQHPVRSIREAAGQVFAGAVNADRQKVIEGYHAVLTTTGDPRRGLRVFSKTCSPCHRLAGVGHAVGPDLASVGDKSPESLLVAILDPNRAVEARYLNYTATTQDGLTFTGVLANETGTSITLLEPEGKRRTILRTDLEDLTSTGKSVMPEGLEKELKVQDLADLIAFVRSGLKPPQRKTFAGNKPELVQPAADGSLRLRTSNCAIYGRTLVLEPKYANLGFWSSADDQAVWTVAAGHAGKYAVWLRWACDNGSAGNTLILQAGTERLQWKVQGTGSWDVYRRVRIGEITLAAGRQEIVCRPGGKVAGALIDLKSIRLVPQSK
jgi:putative membrane-bound dehydrogenase-like protein